MIVVSKEEEIEVVKGEERLRRKHRTSSSDQKDASIIFVLDDRYRVVRSNTMPEGEEGPIEDLPERRGWPTEDTQPGISFLGRVFRDFRMLLDKNSF